MKAIFDIGAEILEHFECVNRRQGLAQCIETHSDYRVRNRATRDFYRLALPEIMAAGSRSWGIEPYEVDWIRRFTPIEDALWFDIRSHGAVLYPQFPIGPFFADFANPAAKLVVECDGRIWHQDIDADRRRQKHIESLGWSVERISGRDCNSADLEEYDEYGHLVIQPSSATEFMRTLVSKYGIAP